ncbi:hypothetical protein SMKI_12G2700 [Saccharomyces mikatae IFO 1815]|uniref:Translation initiation factor eIF2 assembly protein n=1 Tax=Saccharomyces mikatae IFO 1815 TaxID=226126 RepID=A0AA35NC15_SACMI|nr:uncharacterized protein SMKI_12G2700 [Saccharomyces mikatae IFO 1815]CAI4035130.1 hypothetical protein SMKI_12G2700 [Saccharomyces mikatae IFO 1815]
MPSQEYSTLIDIPVTKVQVEHCSYSFWSSLYPKYVPKSIVLKSLPKKFIQYLEQDGIKLPQEENVRSVYTEEIVRNEDNDYSDWEDDEDTATEFVQEVEPLVDFPELHQQLKNALNELGAVAPKLNWSAPRDATWILPNNTMKCNEVNELYLLLNASNYIMHDLQRAFEGCVDGNDIRGLKYDLVLRQWSDMNPALEFRVFVKDTHIVGATQRDLNYYDYLDELSDTFKDLIDEIVHDVVLPKFPDKSFVLDVYIPRPFDRIFIIDINPFSRKTDSLLFSWNEIATITPSRNGASDDEDYELRLVARHNTGRFASKEHSENHVPQDLVEASLNPEAIRELTQKWKELLSQQTQEESSNSENEA